MKCYLQITLISLKNRLSVFHFFSLIRLQHYYKHIFSIKMKNCISKIWKTICIWIVLDLLQMSQTFFQLVHCITP